jgi:hypothetical protein
MQFGQKSEGVWNILLENGDEVHAFSSAYREYVNSRIEEGDTEGISESDIVITNWGEDAEGVDFDTNNPQEIIDILKQFHGNTTQAAQRLAESIPHFANRAAPLRLGLGMVALRLANQIESDYVQEEHIQAVELFNAELEDTPTIDVSQRRPPLRSIGEVQE